MPPKPFYEVKPEAYLFTKHKETSEAKVTPEEKIRQWALFELLSTYGISINNIEVERMVKVGTKNHRADIVILRESAPYVVVECKRWENNKIESGVDQAISYADANTIKAKYAVFTNGDVWIVKRKLRGEWLDVPDISRRIDENYRVELETLIRSMADFKPVLYWLNQEVPKKDAKPYFAKLQEIFCSSTYPLDMLDRNMLFATDNLLRVISCGSSSDTHYLHSKMTVACKGYAQYLARILGNHNDTLSFEGYTLKEMSVFCQNSFNEVVSNSRGMAGEEMAFNRFISALVQYLTKCISRKNDRCEYENVSNILTNEFQGLISLLFDLRLGVTFPDGLLEESCTDLRHFCSGDWERYRLEALR